jgi:hypothetical protein
MPGADDHHRNEPTEPAPNRGRRSFLKLAAGAAVFGALHPLVGRTARVVAAPPGPGTVGMEDLELGPGGLARGSFQGTSGGPDGVTLSGGARLGRYVSPVLVAGGPFTHIGLHWSGSGAEAIGFEVRSGAGNGGWSAWEPVLQEHHVPEGAARTFGALISVDGHHRLQFRATFDASSAPPPLLTGVTATLIDVGEAGSVTSGTLALSTTDGFGLPESAITREGWGVGSSPHNWTRAYVPVKKVVVHHTATTNNYSEATAQNEVRAVWAYHANTLGWGDIGYNAVIDRFGRVYEGRLSRDLAGGREILGAEVVAGHALSHNYGTTGVALLGTFTAQGDGGRPGSPPPDVMWQALVNLVAWECDRHHINPLEATDFLRTDAAWNRGLPNIPGHRDCVATVCPGGHIYSRLGDLRAAVSDRLQRNAPSVALTGPGVESVDASDASALGFSWSATGGSGFAYLLEGWRRHESDPDAIHEFSGYTDESRPDWHGTGATAATFGALFEEFGHTAQIEPGHYTFHVRALDGEASGYAARKTLLVTGEPSGPPATGRIAGTVNGPDGPIAEAAVAVEGTSFETTTDGDGSYAIDSVPEGTYDVTAGAEDFELQTKQVDVAGGGTATLDFELVAVGDDDDDPPPAPLTVTSIAPSEIQSGSSIAVVIRGSGFAPDAAVSFENGQGPRPAASNVQRVDATEIRADVSVSGGGPPRDRPWDVRVTNPDGASADLPGGLTVRR